MADAIDRDPASEPVAQVLVVADDLIWAERLGRAVTTAGARAIRVGSVARLDAVLGDAAANPDAAIVDLTARAYDGLAVTARLADAGLPVLAVGQHDDVQLRKRALAAGARRVLAYRKLADDGPVVVATFLEAHVRAPA